MPNFVEPTIPTHWIIGASSGIGRAVAEAALKRGEAVIISARNTAALAEVAKPYGALCRVLPLDITDPKALIAAVKQLPTLANGPLASVQVYAGAYAPAAVIGGTLESLHTIINTNLTGVLTLIMHLLPQLRAQSAQGHMVQLVLCGSVAGYVGLPNGQPYSATKAALINYAQSLRAEELAHASKTGVMAIDVRIISPGFVKTPLTAKNQFAMPFVLEPHQAATHIWRQLRCPGRFDVCFPLPMVILMKLLSALPSRLYFMLAQRM